MGGRRTASFHRFIRGFVSDSSRVIEIGCGRGELAVALAADGHDVTAIDPDAPPGPLFRPLKLEEFTADEPFDVAVASVSLHHVADPGAAVEQIAALLRPGGLLVLEEFAKERFRGPTARWYFHQRAALGSAGRADADVPCSFERWHQEWNREHADIHPFAELKSNLERRFAERHFEWTPYLYSYALDDSLEPAERALIESREIEPTGCRYVGGRIS